MTSRPSGSPATAAVHEFRRYPDVLAALADPRLVPPPAGTGPPGTTAWLRGSVARFSSGEAHARRRALVRADLARLHPAALRDAANETAGRGTGGCVRAVVVRTLAAALGFAEPDRVAEAVGLVAGAYFGGVDEDTLTAADAAVAWLLPRMLPERPARPPDEPAAEELSPAEWAPEQLELAANRIGLLVQACDATAALIDHATRAADGNHRAGAGTPSVESLLAATLHDRPPVRTMRRVAVGATSVAGTGIAEGDLVLLDVARAALAQGPGAELLTFGAPPRVCPGRDQALAIAAGALEAALQPS